MSNTIAKFSDSVTLNPEQIANIYERFTAVPTKLELVAKDLNLDIGTMRKLLENCKSLSALGRIKLPLTQVKAFRKHYK